jgi:high-affinity nickel-transport protein
VIDTWNVKANNQSGYIGAAIVGGFLMVVVAWYGGEWVAKRLKTKAEVRIEK